MGLATLAGYWRSLRVDSAPVCVNESSSTAAVEEHTISASRCLPPNQRSTAAVVGRLFRGTPAEEERLIIEANRQRVKTPEQKAREFKELKRIEKALAKERQKQGKENLPDPRSAGQARDKAAKQIGMSGLTGTKAA